MPQESFEVNNRTPSSPPPKGHLLLGKEGEDAAAAYLQKKGYRILGRNIRTFGGEIDLIARQGDTIVFVEVKARAGKDTFAPSERVDFHKVRRLRRAAQCWLDAEARKGFKDLPARLDVIGVCGGEVTEHHEDVGM